MYRMSYRQSVLTTDGISNDDVDAEGHSDKKVEYQSDNRNISSDAGDSNGIVGPAEMTDDGQIRSQEQLFQNNSCCYRQGKQRDLIPKRTVQHIYFKHFFDGRHASYLFLPWWVSS